MDTREQVLATLRGLKEEIRARYKATVVGIFGSISRGEAREASDVDVLVDFDEDADLLDLVGLALFLEEQLHRKVDVVPKRALRAELGEAVLREVATL